ncbi:hypothetical protein KDA00_00300 [Candidatus Saccharibacteria bacterium]|nr:hypothetical protein [Candidatus Saccharibacteria bacterium]
MIKKVVLISISALSMLLVANFVISYFNSFQKLEIKYADGVSDVEVNIYKNIDGHDIDPKTPLENTEATPVASVNADEVLKLKKGEYLLDVKENDLYKNYRFELSLDKDIATVTIDPEFTDKKLEELLNADKSNIHKMINSAFPQIANNNLRIGDGRLFKRGEWYGTMIFPALSEEEIKNSYFDIYHLVLKKENGQWKIVTTPPDLVLSSQKYLDIPEDVLSATNDIRP